MAISTNGLISAMSALAREIERLNEMAAAGHEDAPGQEELEQEILDMTAALSELGGLYEDHRKSTPSLPPLGELKLGR